MPDGNLLPESPVVPESNLLDALRTIVREELAAAASAPEIVDADQLSAMLAMSRASLYRANDDGKIPRPLKLDLRGCRWSVREIRAWVSAGCPTRVTWESMRGSRIGGAS